MSEPSIKDFILNSKDYGKEPLETPLSSEQKKLAAIAMGINAALVQFINEGVIAHEQQLHFMLHLQDFTARIYAGEDLKFDNVEQTLQVNSVAGKLFAAAAEEALINGHNNYVKIKEMAAKAKAEQTNNLDANASVDKKPTFH